MLSLFAAQPILQDGLLVLSHLPLVTSLVTLLVNVYLLVLAATILFRCPVSILAQMGGNLWLDGVLWFVAALGSSLGGASGTGWISAARGMGDGLRGAGLRNLGLLEVSPLRLLRSVPRRAADRRVLIDRTGCSRSPHRSPRSC